MALQHSRKRWTACLALLAAVGCQQEAPVAPRPTGTPAPTALVTLAPVNPAPTQAVATAPATSAPTSAPSGEPSPLPAATVDSDLAQDDEAAVESLLDSDELKTYLPNDLIHDGGVILYQTLALGAGLKKRTGCGGPEDPPDIWKRVDAATGGRELHVRKVGGQPGLAMAEIKYQSHGQFVYKDGGATVKKKFVETFRRQIQLERTSKEWRPVAISPMSIESQGGRSGLEVKGVSLYRGAAANPTLAFGEDDRLVSIKDPLPAFPAGGSVRVEVEVSDKQACDLFVFAYLVGGNDRSRQRLFDDATNGDKTAGDGIYAGSFVLPATAGTRHLAVDVLEPTVFTPGGIYRSNVVGMTFAVTKP